MARRSAPERRGDACGRSAGRVGDAVGAVRAEYASRTWCVLRAWCALSAGLVVLLAATAAHAAPPSSPAGFVGWPRAMVEIRTRSGSLQLHATIADTPARQEQGLMFVRALDADESMWFPQERPRLMQMWMKNTLLPLDMLFVDRRGRIACIAARTVPQSLELIGCPVAVSGVLEISAGEAGRQGMRVGDRLELDLTANRP